MERSVTKVRLDPADERAIAAARGHGAAPPGHWSRVRESGTTFGVRLLYHLHRWLGRRFYRVVLGGVALWFTASRADLRAASRDWLETHAARFPDYWNNRRPGVLDVTRHFHAFGEAILDKALAWSEIPSADEFTFADETIVRDTMADSVGQLVIGSHFGNLEYCRGFARAEHERTVNILVHDRNSLHFVEAMTRVSPDSRLHVYQVDELDVGRLLELKARIAEGEWLFIAGDRVPLTGDARTVSIDFLGRPARFPVGPYVLARTLDCPVKLMFTVRRGDTVHVDLQHFADRIELPRGARDEALADCATRFAAALEAQTKDEPYQWFNFYRFWTR